LAESDAFVGRKRENWTFIPIRSQFLFLQQFRKRYKEWDDPHNETGPYHYGAHYSSAMIVCSYLVRLGPFTQQFLGSLPSCEDSSEGHEGPDSSKMI
jgi:hypothetical protein